LFILFYKYALIILLIHLVEFHFKSNRERKSKFIKVASREAGSEYGSIVENNQHSCKLFKNYLMSFFLHPGYFLQTNS